MNNPFIDILRSVSEKFPQKPAIIKDGRHISFGALNSRVEQYDAYFCRKGMGPGDRILIYVPMGIDLYVILLAIWRRGAVAVFVDAWTSRKRLQHVAEITSCKAFIGIPKAHLLRLLAPAVRSIPIKIWVMPFGQKKQGFKIVPPEYVNGGDTALVTFTTGSTGTPKGADRSFDFLLAQNRVLRKHLNLSPGDIDLATLPVFVLNNLALGITSVLPPFNTAKPENANPQKMLEAIQKYQITCSAGSPVIYEKLAEYCLAHRIVPAKLKKIFIGGAPVFPQTAKKLMLAFPETDIEIVYGSTEAEPISAISAEELCKQKKKVMDAGLPVGRPVKQIELAILKITEAQLPGMDSKAFAKLCLGNGEVGEICVTGGHVLKKYFRNPKAERKNKIHVSGKVWHRTGDAGYLDKNGLLYLMGRVGGRITFKGRNYFSFPLEGALGSIRGVRLGTVLELKGGIVAAVELEDRSAETKRRVEKVVSQFQIPETVQITYITIPRDPRHNSKIDYYALKRKLKG